MLLIPVQQFNTAGYTHGKVAAVAFALYKTRKILMLAKGKGKRNPGNTMMNA